MTHAAESSDPARTLRIGHAERDDAIEALREAAAEGRLSTDELTERIERVAAAKVYADLDAVLEDLPVPPPSHALRETAAGHFGALPTAGAGASRHSACQLAADDPGWHPLDPLVLHAGWENEKRRGRWTAVPFIRVEAVGATVELNFLEVVTDIADIEVDVASSFGSTVIVVPEDWGVNIDRLRSGWGSVKSKVAAQPQPGQPRIIVHGNVGMGSFVARHAGYLDRRRLERG